VFNGPLYDRQWTRKLSISTPCDKDSFIYIIARLKKLNYGRRSVCDRLPPSIKYEMGGLW
jgi:hypothetical protein